MFDNNCNNYFRRMSLIERRNCVEEPADYVCEWNWCWQISLIYIRVLACSPFGTLMFLIGSLACRRGSSNTDHQGSGVI